MTCYRPNPAWRTMETNSKGEKVPVISETGKTPVTFKNRGSHLDADFLLPCGTCDGCAADKAMYWGIRMYHEAQLHDRNCFVTLTYREAPEKIQKDHLQKFFKRLRKRSTRRIRYFACGEYGEKTHRPHYHLALFNEDFLGGAYSVNHQLYGNKILDRIWTYGNCVLSEFNLSTALYIAGYTAKKINDPDTFNLMSTRPPLGKEWARQNIDSMERIGAVMIEGQRFPIPPQYFNWFPTELDHIQGRKMAYVKTRTGQELRNKEMNAKGVKQTKKGESL